MAIIIGRRRFIVGGAVAWPVAARAQQSETPGVINGQRIPFTYPAAMNFIMCDESSPFSKNVTPEFDGFDIAVATALAEVQDASKQRIDYTIKKAESLPRSPSF